MPEIILINYADQGYVKAQAKNTRTGSRFGGFTKVINFQKKHLGQHFLNRNKELFSKRRGAGYWVWKPYIMLYTLQNLSKPGDWIFYSDSGSHFTGSIMPWIHHAERKRQNMVFFDVGPSHPERRWSKRDAFVYMQCDSEAYANSIQRLSGYQLVRNCPEAIRFYHECLRYNEDIRIVSDEENTCRKPNYEGFEENRHDQTVLSLLSKKWKIPSWPRPDAPQKNWPLPNFVVTARWSQ
jgi:hypothetical protein